MKKLILIIIGLLALFSLSAYSSYKDIPQDINEYTLLIEKFEFRNPEDFKNKTLQNSYFNETGELIYREKSAQSKGMDDAFNLESYLKSTNKRLDKSNDKLMDKFRSYYSHKMVFVNSSDVENFDKKTHRYVIKRSIDVQSTSNGSLLNDCFYIYDRELKKSYRTNYFVSGTVLSFIAELNSAKAN